MYKLLSDGADWTFCPVSSQARTREETATETTQLIVESSQARTRWAPRKGSQKSDEPIFSGAHAMGTKRYLSTDTFSASPRARCRIEGH